MIRRVSLVSSKLSAGQVDSEEGDENQMLSVPEDNEDGNSEKNQEDNTPDSISIESGGETKENSSAGSGDKPQKREPEVQRIPDAVDDRLQVIKEAFNIEKCRGAHVALW